MFSLALLSLTLLADAETKPSRLAVIQKAPDFALTTQDEKSLRLADLKGKVALVSFVFTTCNGTCPATTARMAQVQAELKSRGRLKDSSVQLLSITLDPTRDSPDALRRYLKLYDADPASWSALTGSAEDVNKVLAAWDMWAKPAANGQLDHPSRIYLVDRKGQVREIYHLGFMKAAWVVEDIESLLNEKHR
ncbi:MAG: SCO family protein [Gemmataceae bacterium]|nr:SCO family protein [Gemmataceae bacterium]